MIHRWRLAAVATLLVALALGNSSRGPAQTPPVVRVQAPAVESWMQAYFADQTGRFEKAGLHVDLTIPVSAANILTAVGTGEADIGIAATTAIAQAVSGGLPLVVIAAAAVSTPQSQVDTICVAKTSPIQTAKDLEGKTVGVIGLRQFGDLALRAWMTKNGADTANVKVVQAPFSSMGAGLEHGTYDAAVMAEPTLTYALRNNAIRCIANPDLAIAQRFLLGAWVTNKTYLAANPDVVKRVVAVLEETARWANRNRGETATLVAKLTKIDIDLIRNERMRAVFGERLDPTEIQVPLDAAFAFHFLPRKITANELLGR